MNREEIIIKYLDNQLTFEEKIIFEKQLSESEEFRTEFNRYVHIKSQLTDLKGIETDKLYFNSVVPRFRQKQQTQLKSLAFKKFGYSFSVITVIIISFIVFNLVLSKSETTDLIQFTESLTAEERLELLSTLNGEISSEYLGEVYLELIQTNIATELLGVEDKYLIADAYDLEINHIEDFVTQEEFESIYNELISIQFFNEETL